MKKIALFGCGGFAQNHMREINKWNNITIAYLIDPSDSNKNKFVGILQNSGKPKPQTFSSLEEFLISNPDYDAGIIVSPPETHFPIAYSILNDNKSLYAEKPLTTKAQDAKKLNDLAKSKNLEIVIGTNRCVFAAYRAGANAVKAGKVGKVKGISMFYRNTWEKSTQKNWRQNPDCAGSGLLADYGPHCGHFLFTDLNYMPHKVRHLGSRFNKAGVDVDTAYLMTDKTGITAIIVLDGSPSADLRNEEVKVYGTKGNVAIRFEKGASGAYIQKTGKEELIDTSQAISEINSLGIKDYKSHPALIHNFLSLITGNTTINANPGETGILPVHLTELVQESRKAMKPDSFGKTDLEKITRLIKTDDWLNKESLIDYYQNGKEITIDKNYIK